MWILVCDDEANVVDEMSCMLQDIFKTKSIDITIAKSTNPGEIVESNETYDMAFLDIEMGERNGIEVEETLLKRNPECFIFFITNYSIYLDDAFDVKAFRYINKPIDRKRIISSVNKALMKIEERNKTIVLTKKTKRKVKISVSSIIYIENSSRHTYVVTKEDTFIADEPFAEVKALLEKESNSFILTHQSFFVNIKFVSYYDNTIVKLAHKDKVYEVHMSRRKFADFDDKMFLEANK